jgi:hypothetical protein
MRPMRLAVGVLLLAIALVGALLAHDVRSWRHTLNEDAARYAVDPGGPEVWTAPTLLPAGGSARLLAVQRDRQWLSTLRFFTNAYRIVRTVDPQYLTAEQHHVIETALAKLSTATQVPAASRASQAFDLLALLELSQLKVVSGAIDVAAANAAVANFQNAIRADAGNAQAKVNLELELRALADNPLYDALAPAGGDRASGKRTGAAGRPTGSGY